MLWARAARTYMYTYIRTYSARTYINRVQTRSQTKHNYLYYQWFNNEHWISSLRDENCLILIVIVYVMTVILEHQCHGECNGF